MASTQVKAERRAKVVQRLSDSLGVKPVDLNAQARGDSGMALIMTLERVADAVDKVKPAVPGDALRAAILAASDEELTAIPGVGEKSVDQLREWAKTPPPVTPENVEQQLEAETGHDVVKTSDKPPTFVETSKPAPKVKSK